MKKILIPASIVVVSAALVVFILINGKTVGSATSNYQNTQVPTSNSTIQPTSNSSAQNTVTNTPTTSSNASSSTSGYKDGTFSGGQIYNGYENIEVSVTVSGGKISAVNADSPDAQGNSYYITSQALPMLKQEVLNAQSGQVDTISGATATSQAFIQSLQNALSKAS